MWPPRLLTKPGPPSTPSPEMIGDEFHDWIKAWQSYSEITEPITNSDVESEAPPESDAELAGDNCNYKDKNDNSWYDSWQSGEWAWSSRRGWWWIEHAGDGDDDNTWGKWQAAENLEEEEEQEWWHADAEPVEWHAEPEEWHADDENQPEHVKDSSEEEPAERWNKKTLPQLKSKGFGKKRERDDDDGWHWGEQDFEKHQKTMSWSTKTIHSQSTASASLSTWSRR